MQRVWSGALLVCAFFGWVAPATGQAVWVAKPCLEIPRTQEALAAAHQSSTDAAVQVPPGDPMALGDFSGTESYTVRVRNSTGKTESRKIPFNFSRQPVVSYGLQLDPEDQERLPTASKGRIISRLASNFVCIQARVQQNAATGDIYLHYKPYAAIGDYNGSAEAQEFAALMEDSVRDVRSIGHFMKEGTKPTAEAFRTLVIVNKNITEQVDEQTGEISLEPQYDLVLMRLRLNDGEPEIHCFATTKKLAKLHYLAPYTHPGSPEECSAASTIYFTDYTLAKQSPSAKATKRIELQSRGDFTMDELDAYTAEAGLSGDALANIDAILDAIIDGQLTPQ